jgi:hypothetical protein
MVMIADSDKAKVVSTAVAELTITGPVEATDCVDPLDAVGETVMGREAAEVGVVDVAAVAVAVTSAEAAELRVPGGNDEVRLIGAEVATADVGVKVEEGVAAGTDVADGIEVGVMEEVGLEEVNVPDGAEVAVVEDRGAERVDIAVTVELDPPAGCAEADEVTEVAGAAEDDEAGAG